MPISARGQKYIVLTFHSLFIVYMLTYVLTKFNTALGQKYKEEEVSATPLYDEQTRYDI
jgi:hypothetical protein